MKYYTIFILLVLSISYLSFTYSDADYVIYENFSVENQSSRLWGPYIIETNSAEHYMSNICGIYNDSGYLFAKNTGYFGSDADRSATCGYGTNSSTIDLRYAKRIRMAFNYSINDGAGTSVGQGLTVHICVESEQLNKTAWDHSDNTDRHQNCTNALFGHATTIIGSCPAVTDWGFGSMWNNDCQESAGYLIIEMSNQTYDAKYRATWKDQQTYVYSHPQPLPLEDEPFQLRFYPEAKPNWVNFYSETDLYIFNISYQPWGDNESLFANNATYQMSTINFTSDGGQACGFNSTDSSYVTCGPTSDTTPTFKFQANNSGAFYRMYEYTGNFYNYTELALEYIDYSECTQEVDGYNFTCTYPYHLTNGEHTLIVTPLVRTPTLFLEQQSYNEFPTNTFNISVNRSVRKLQIWRDIDTDEDVGWIDTDGDFYHKGNSLTENWNLTWNGSSLIGQVQGSTWLVVTP